MKRTVSKKNNKKKKSRAFNRAQSNKNITGSSKRRNKKSKNRKHTKSSETMKMIPIGGLAEIGKNMTVFEYKDQAIIVDCGLKFPDDEMLGVDIVLPDFDYVEKNKDKIKGLIVTHGHEDHIGGIAYLEKVHNIPIYATKLTRGLIEHKLRENGLIDKVKINTIKSGESFKIGDFDIEPIKVTHSIADSVAFAIKTPVATVVHTGDFKIDYNPIDGEVIDLQRFAQLGAEGVDLLLADSTNVEEGGYTASESSLAETFYNVFRGCKNRIIVTTFASNIHRIQQIIDAANAYNRKVVISGRSMENMVNVAKDLGYLKVPKNTIISVRDMDKYRPKDLVIITTGSQGEPMAALGRMANDDHSFLNVGKNDTIIISASPVPGNEKLVSEVIDKLIRKGSEVIYQKLAETHVSGHGKREELKLIQALTKPKFFVPVHGETRMLLHHKNLAENMGVPSKNIFILNNGEQLEFNHDKAKVIKDKISANAVLVDGLGVGDIGNIVLNDRKRLSEDGLFIVVQKMDHSKPVGSPDIISRGFVYVNNNQELIDEARREVEKILASCKDRHLVDWSDIKGEIRSHLHRYFKEKLQRYPMVLPILIDVSNERNIKDLNLT